MGEHGIALPTPLHFLAQCHYNPKTQSARRDMESGSTVIITTKDN